MKSNLKSNGNLKYQKIIKVGNSLAMTIDRDFVAKTGVKAGDLAAVNYQPDAKVVSYAPVASASSVTGVAEPTAKFEHEVKVASAVTPELEAWTKKFIQENKEALKKLANL